MKMTQKRQKALQRAIKSQKAFRLYWHPNVMMPQSLMDMKRCEFHWAKGRSDHGKVQML